jgi:transcriptional regulator with XRE-family HTH domain
MEPYLCNKCKMIGRPKRIPDAQLAERLRARRISLRLSFAAMAKSLGVATSTLTRSLNKNSFSQDLGVRAREMLDDPTAFAERQKVSAETALAIKKLSAEDLHILHKIVNLMPKAEVILRNLVKRSARRDTA